MNRYKVMREDTPKLLLIFITAVTLGSVSGDTCERGQTWWDRSKGVCIPCTRCDPTQRLALKFPCELHRDAVCQPLYEIRIWPFSTTIETRDNDASELSSDSEYYEDFGGEVTETNSEVNWDLQTSTLTVAACGCIFFFIVVLVLSLMHAKQWKVLKQALKSDVQELSAKLKLMEAGNDPATQTVVSTDHHLYSNIHVSKDALLGPAAVKKGFGNVYTQEKHPS